MRQRSPSKNPNELRLTVGEGFDPSFKEPTVVQRGTTLPSGTPAALPLVFGGGVRNWDECDICLEFGIVMHFRVDDTHANTQRVDGNTNFNCI